jgi:hypothetical protein
MAVAFSPKLEGASSILASSVHGRGQAGGLSCNDLLEVFLKSHATFLGLSRQALLYVRIQVQDYHH